MDAHPTRVHPVSTTAEEDLSRVTIISQSRRVDLALPGSVTLSELLPSILRFSGLEANAPTEAVHAWVLQRFGADPFDLYTPVSNLGIRDGETLHLRQRENAIPDAAFDDVVDAVAGATNSRPSWSPRHSRIVGLVLMMMVLLGLPLLSLRGAVRILPDEGGDTAVLLALGMTFFIGLAALVGCIALARATSERAVATSLGWVGVVLFFAAGWYLPNLIAVPPIPVAVRILIAFALALVASAVAALAAAVHTMPMLAVALTSGFMIISASFMALNYDSMNNDMNIEVAGVTMAVMAVMTNFLPALSYRIAGIALPNLPSNAEAILADETPVQSDIVNRALLADRLLGAMLTATAATAVISSFIVIRQGSRWSLALVLCVGLAFLLRARAFVGLTQRFSLLIGGLLLFWLAVLALTLGTPGNIQAMVIVFGLVLAVGYIFAHYSASTYAKIVSPTWGRWGDILEWLAIIGIVPSLLGVLDLYSYFGSLFS